METFLGVHKFRWVGIRRRYLSRERLTTISLNRSICSSWESICRGRTVEDPNIVSGTDKADQDPYDVGVLQYAERVREILDVPIQWRGTRKPILIIQAKSTLIYQSVVLIRIKDDLQ